MGDANIFKVLSDRQRRDILVLLKNGPRNAGELARELGISPAALSYHLKLLKDADLVMEFLLNDSASSEINTSVFDELLLWVAQFKSSKG